MEKQVLSWHAKNSYIWCINTWKSRFSHDATENKVYIWCNFTFRSRFSRDATKTLIFDALLCGKAGFLMTRQKGANLLHYYVEKQVFAWRAKKVQLCCIITWKSRFSHYTPERCSLLHYYVEKHDFAWCDRKQSVHFVSKQVFSWRAKTLILDAYYVAKQVFSWRAKNPYIWCIYTWKSRFSHDVTENKVYIWCIITWKSRFYHDAPKTLIFDALIRGKAGFLMTPPKTKCTFDAIFNFVAGFLVTRQKLLYLMHYYVEKQVFSWRAKKVQICCIIMWKSMFSHDAPKTFIFDAFILGKPGFLMTRQKGSHLLHYYVEKQVFSWRAKKSYIWCIYTWKSRFSHDATENNVYIWCIIMFRSRFSHDAPKNLYLMHYYLEKQFFSWRTKNLYLMHYY